ncbi:MAG TPA: ATP-dependent Clp protease ATP-binding subunit ClpA [Deltaproteobacteria bacterium]|nr:MAG: ATP-dependent Clp protease ATP-binding subunit ClpA [Deltaproteobacteria bacterium GWA2_45_12]HBF12415.1 ATP-dependent Clp protease ATP-binding subunit ClpA [Deltaproteobacteria bacterium]
MIIAEELEKTLQRAYNEAKARKHEFIALEHLLYALTYDPLTSDILIHCGGNIQNLREKLEEFFKTKMQGVPTEIAPRYSVGVQMVLQTAAIHAQSSSTEKIDGGCVLAALFREKESHAVYFLGEQNISRLDVLRYISHKISKIQLAPSHHGLPAKTDEKTDSTSFPYCTNLNEKAKKGQIDPLIGRTKETERMIHVLLRRRKNNPILVGDAGVGKTAIAEGLALKIVKKEIPAILESAVIYHLDLAGLLAGTKFRGEFEERLKQVLDLFSENKNAILFVDEIHTVIGAGAVSGGSLDASNLLKPVLASGNLRCIGTTTYKDYRTTFEKDHAFSRRFQKIEINEATVEDTIQILDGLKSHYENFHGVTYQPEALKAACELSAQFIHDRFLPDKAIDVIDEVGAEQKLKNQTPTRPIITAEQIETMVSRMAKVPTQTVKTDDRDKLKNLKTELRKVIYGQETAITQIVASIQLAKAGLGDPLRPLGSFLFSGPTGVGKTELAKQLAKHMGIEFVRFDMSEYMEKHSVARLIGAPPGYVGYDEGGLLTEAIHKNPHAVLLLDEIEKAHPDLMNILLQIMDYGVLTDNNGRKSNFHQVILIMTTNTGARESMVKTIGFGAKEFEDKSAKEIEKTFNPEFRNRLTSIVSFNALTPTIALQIVEKALFELQEKLTVKKINLQLDAASKKYLAEKGFDTKFGARPVKRLIENEIAKPLSEEILFGKLNEGGKVKITFSKGKLTFKINVTDQRKGNS